MTLEISLRKPFSLQRVLGAGKGESRQDYHWIGQKQKTDQQPVPTGEQNKNPQGRKNKQKYLPLTDLTLGDVEDAIKLFEYQLVPAHENWIGKNTFCQIPLKRKRGQPPMVFGRVKTCYPSDGVLDNIEELEMYFPRKEGIPDLIHIHKDEISHRSQIQVQSYFVRVCVLVSAEEKAELTESALMLSVNGFYPEFELGFLNILDLDEGNRYLHPHLYVIGSRWFAALPESLHTEMQAKLKEMINWGKQIFNYHPDWLANNINTLNRILGYKYGFTSNVLTEPGNAKEITSILTKTFEQMMLIP